MARSLKKYFFAASLAYTIHIYVALIWFFEFFNSISKYFKRTLQFCFSNFLLTRMYVHRIGALLFWFRIIRKRVWYSILNKNKNYARDIYFFILSALPPIQSRVIRSCPMAPGGYITFEDFLF